MRRIFRTVAMAGLVSAAFALAGCAGPISSNATGTPSNAVPVTTAASSEAARSTATAQASPSGKASAASACPVSEEALFAALKADVAFYQRAGKPTALYHVTCYDNYATVGAEIDGRKLQGAIFFGYDPATMTWRPLNMGSAGYCKGYVSPEIASHFLCG